MKLADKQPSERCPATGKVCKVTRSHAKKFAKHMGSMHRKKYDVYRCAYCRFWHLSTALGPEKGLRSMRDWVELILATVARMR